MANFELEIRELRFVIPGSEDESDLEAAVRFLLRNLNRSREKGKIFSPSCFLARGLGFENGSYRQGFGKLTPRVRGAAHRVLFSPMFSQRICHNRRDARSRTTGLHLRRGRQAHGNEDQPGRFGNDPQIRI